MVPRRLHWGVVVLGCLAALLTTGCGQAGQFSADDPRSAVKQLLIATLAQANGQRACSLLTVDERRHYDDGPAGSCRQAFNNSVTSMPGPYSATDDAGRPAEDLHYDVVRHDGRHATVTARKRDDRALTFDVVQLTPKELEDDDASGSGAVSNETNSDWRVSKGAGQLLEVDN